jgi:archaemetzincin
VKIAVASVGRLDPQDFRVAVQKVESLFGCECQPCAPIEIPAAFDARRNQHSSVAFMLALSRANFGDVDRVLGVTGCDLFIPMLTFVFGQAQLNGRVALVSLARLRQEFYGAAPDPPLLAARMRKEIGHELGHSFGLIHCAERGCLMSLATSIQDVDRRTGEFCPSCQVLVGQELQLKEVGR